MLEQAQVRSGDGSASAERLEESETGAAAAAPASLKRSVEWRLYLSHFLSTWNSRSFEFGAVLFLAHVYPSTLLYLSLYAIVRSASAIVFSPWVGRAIDLYPRKHVVRASIVLGRLSTVLSALGFWGLWEHRNIVPSDRGAIFAFLTLFACVERMAFITNTVSIERDWVIEIAHGQGATLQTLNARMRRIDLTCKLAGPLFISLIDGASTRWAIWVTLALNAVSLPIEYFAIAKVYNLVPELKAPRAQTGEETSPSSLMSMRAIFQHFMSIVRTVPSYFQHPACAPSFSLALLYLTVLSFGGQMVTYLLSTGFNSFYIALARSLSVLVELSATWVAPRLMRRIGAIRGGMWFLSWQMLWLAATVAFFWTSPSPLAAAAGLSAGTSISRVGLWGYDLCAQMIIQEEVRQTSRGSFSSTEQLLQNVFELLSYVLTIAAPQPDQFRYPVLVSAAAVLASGALYARFLRSRRGHLSHLSFKKLKPAPARPQGAGGPVRAT